jgi:hypothetical protein
LGGVGERWAKNPTFSIRKEFKVIHVTLSMYLASLAFILCLDKKIEMTGIVTRTYLKSAPETYYTFTRKKSSEMQSAIYVMQHALPYKLHNEKRAKIESRLMFCY